MTMTYDDDHKIVAVTTLSLLLSMMTEGKNKISKRIKPSER